MRLPNPMPDASRNREGHNPVKDRRGAGSVWDLPVSLRCRCKWSPRLSPGTTLFVYMQAKIFREILQRTLKRLYCSRRKRTERIPRSKKFRLEHERIEIASAPSALLHCEQNLLRPRQPAPARRAPAARFLRKEMLEIPNHPDGTGAVVQHNHGSRAQPASRLLHVPVVHRRVKMLLYKEVGRRSARQQPTETQAVAHSSGMVLEDLTQRRAHGKFPESRPPDLATDAKQLRASIFG